MCSLFFEKIAYIVIETAILKKDRLFFCFSIIVISENIDYNINMMIQERKRLFNKAQTGKAMYRLVEKFYRDLEKFFVRVNGRTVPVGNMTIVQYHDLVRSLPYRQDTKPIEVIARPKHLFRHRKMGLDCKKKGILVGSFLKLRGIPYRFVGSSNRNNKRIHHVFPQGLIAGEWKNIDATYAHYKPFTKKKVTACEIL